MTRIQRAEITPGYTISRLLKGGWQLAGDHGKIDHQGALADMANYYDAGINTFDCADIYTGVEEMIGEFRAHYLATRGADSLSQLKIHTKFVPDLSSLATIDRRLVERTIDRSLARLRVERLDLVQFHWWDYSVQRYLDVASWLHELQRVGKIDKLGGTNFDTQHTRELLDAGVKLASMQVQYSLLDQRPAQQMTALAEAHGFSLLCYGTIAGGFLSEKWLGALEPDRAISNRSLIKYKLIIDDFGGWELFQALLAALDSIAKKHGVSIATVATRWVLDQKCVAGAIVGVRRGNHLPEHVRVFSLTLDDADRVALDRVLAKRKPIDGDVYTVERDIGGRHGTIMKYELNQVA